MFVERRNKKLVENAARSNAVVTSLFPGTMRDKVLDEGEGILVASRRTRRKKMKSFLSTGESEDGDTEKDESFLLDTKPLAELL